ncbi:MAG: hypothetical protein KJ709_08605 [Nanoarchaeota archaeon]|nr:hypothetical protein [Nanoarchaeota archaeon]
MKKKHLEKSSSPKILIKEIKRCNRNLFIISLFIAVISGFITYILLMTIYGLIFSICAYGLVGYLLYLVYIRNLDYNKSPIIIQMKRFSENKKNVILELVKELNERKNKIEFRNVIITSSWLCQRTFLFFKVFHFSQLYWVYIKKTRHYTNFIPSGTTWELVFNLFDGKDIIGYPTKSGNKKDSETIIEEIHKRVPWAFFGYSDEIKNEWQNNPIVIINAVHERILEIQEQLKK